MRAIDVAWPKTIRIGAFDWRVVIVPPDRHSLGRRYNGMTDTYRLELGVAGDLEMPRAIEVLMHEIFHAIFVQQHFPHEEEKTVCILSPALLSLWRDNPDLHPWMMRHLTKPRR